MLELSLLKCCTACMPALGASCTGQIDFFISNQSLKLNSRDTVSDQQLKANLIEAICLFVCLLSSRYQFTNSLKANINRLKRTSVTLIKGCVRVCLSCSLISAYNNWFRLFFAVLVPRHRRVCGIRQSTQSSSPKVCEKGIWVHANDCRRVRTREVDAGELAVFDWFISGASRSWCHRLVTFDCFLDSLVTPFTL